MTPKVTPLADLVPDEIGQASAERMFAPVPTLPAHGTRMAAGLVHAETLVDALDADDAELAAAGTRLVLCRR